MSCKEGHTRLFLFPSLSRSLNFLSINSAFCVSTCISSALSLSHQHPHTQQIQRLRWFFECLPEGAKLHTCYLMSFNTVITVLYFLFCHPATQMYDKETHTHTLKKTVTLMSIPSQSSDSLQWAFSRGSLFRCVSISGFQWFLFCLFFKLVNKRGFFHRC